MAQDSEIFAMHKGAKGALRTIGILFCVMIFTIPVGIYVLLRVGRARVEVGPDAVAAFAIGSKRVAIADIVRVGEVRVPLNAHGPADVGARKKCGGDTAIHLAMLTRSGKTVMFMASMYSDHQRMMDSVAARVGKPIELLEMGALKPKWIEQA